MRLVPREAPRIFVWREYIDISTCIRQQRDTEASLIHFSDICSRLLTIFEICNLFRSIYVLHILILIWSDGSWYIRRSLFWTCQLSGSTRTHCNSLREEWTRSRVTSGLTVRLPLYLHVAKQESSLDFLLQLCADVKSLHDIHLSSI